MLVALVVWDALWRGLSEARSDVEPVDGKLPSHVDPLVPRKVGDIR